MSDHSNPGNKTATEPLPPVLAETLFAALTHHETTLALVARQLHDDVSQVLSAAGLQLDAMRMDFRDAAPGIDQRAAEIQEMLERAIEQLRDISNELNPSIVERAGLHFALERLAGKARKDFAGSLRLHFASATHVPTAQAITFYKIAEYALDAALARARCSLIELQVKKSRGEFVLELNDNGEFEEPDSSAPALNRLLMDYYASKEGFSLTVLGSASGGNTVRATCPAQRTEI